MSLSKIMSKFVPDFTKQEIIDFIWKNNIVALMKYAVSGILTAIYTEEVFNEIICQYLPHIAACIRAKQDILPTVLEKVAEEGSKNKTMEEIVATTTKLNRAKDGAKGSIKAGLIIESLCFSCKLLSAYGKYSCGEIKSLKEFCNQVLKDGGSSAGSVLGGVVGAAVGTALCPGIGTFVGNVLGESVGGVLGSIIASSYDFANCLVKWV